MDQMKLIEFWHHHNIIQQQQLEIDDKPEILNEKSIPPTKKLQYNQTHITQYVGRQLTKEILTFEKKLIRMTVSNGFSFHWIDNYETRELFNFISPLLVLSKNSEFLC